MRYRALVVAASSGGFAALQRLLAGLRPGLPVPVVAVLHRPAAEPDALASTLAAKSALPLVEARSWMPLQAGVVHLAPAGYHVLIESARRLALSTDEKVRHVRPAADVLFASAADVFGRELIAVVLTGANDDGAEGAAAVRAAGGLVIVQDPDDAQAARMPAAALARAGADFVLPLRRIEQRLNLLLCGEP